MPTRKPNPKRLEIDGNPYIYWVRALPYDETDAVPLRVVIRADFGNRSTCTFTGLKNRERWHDYPNWNQELTIAITPKVVCDLVHYAHGVGWEPLSDRANLTLVVDNAILSRPSVSDTNQENA